MKKIHNILLLAACFILLFLTESEIKSQKELQYQNYKMAEEFQILQSQMKQCENELTTLKQDYVKEISAESCVILCFDDLGKSDFQTIAEEMDLYGWHGVMIFRDGVFPGDKGSISIELYQQLTEQGWETAIGNKKDIRVYNNFPEIRKKAWAEYIESMQKGFEERGLSSPTVYIPHQNESVSAVEDLLVSYGLDSYMMPYANAEEAATGINTDAFVVMGAFTSGFHYNNLEEDLTGLLPLADSVALWYRRVEFGIPQNSAYTTGSNVKTQLSILEKLDGDVKVTTFSEYRAYQKKLVETHAQITENYQIEKKKIEDELATLKENVKKILMLRN